MNDPVETQRRHRGMLALLGEMVRTRAELAALDFEDRVHLSLTAAVLGVVAIVLSLVAFTFIGIAVIALFWDTHRIAATVTTTLAYLSLAAASVAAARSKWRARPPVLAATLGEIQKDIEALRSRL